MKRVKFSSYILSALLVGCLTIPVSFGADSRTRAAADVSSDALVLDVAFDGKSLSYSRPDAWGSGVARGDTFIVTGRIYAAGSIPDGDTTYTFAANSDGSIGSVVSTGMYTVDATAIAAGEPLYASTSHVILLDTGDGLMTQGLEGSVDEIRFLIGGMGQYSGAVGQVTQQVLGTNDTGGQNVRLTFQMVRTNPQPTNQAQAIRNAARKK